MRMRSCWQAKEEAAAKAAEERVRAEEEARKAALRQQPARLSKEQRMAKNECAMLKRRGTHTLGHP